MVDPGGGGAILTRVPGGGTGPRPSHSGCPHGEELKERIPVGAPFPPSVVL
ncbi:MAG: hypothetical protein QHH04_02350 [Methanolinea sp.]|nr:hypothetical protein [Methanolinea sp.]